MIDYTLFFGLFIVTFLDLAFRWVAFGRVESFAIDIVLFTTAYAAVEAAHKLGDKVGTSTTAWDVRFIINLVILMGLLVTHKVYTEQLKKQAIRKLDQVATSIRKIRPRRQNLEDAITRLSATRDIMERNVVLALEVPLVRNGYLRRGKANWRLELVDMLNALTPPAVEKWTEDDFLLPKTTRLCILAGFATGAAVSIIALTTSLVSNFVTNSPH